MLNLAARGAPARMSQPQIASDGSRILFADARGISQGNPGVFLISNDNTLLATVNEGGSKSLRKKAFCESIDLDV